MGSFGGQSYPYPKRNTFPQLSDRITEATMTMNTMTTLIHCYNKQKKVHQKYWVLFLDPQVIFGYVGPL